MAVIYDIPSHCELGVILEHIVMLVFAPITLPFKYKTRVQDADDFWVNYCADCALRSTICRVSGALSNGNCRLNNTANSQTVVQTIQMPVPRHILFFDNSRDNIRFAYERPDGALYAMRMSNIYGNGSWCSGDINYNTGDPTSIYEGYFNSIHNHDLSPSDSDYTQFIEGLANGTHTMDYDSYNFDPEDRWGSAKYVCEKPSKIKWSDSVEQGFFNLGYRSYVKIS